MLVRVSITLAIVSAVLFGVWKFGIGQYRGRVSPYAIVLVTSTLGRAFYRKVSGKLSAGPVNYLTRHSADGLGGWMGPRMAGGAPVPTSFSAGDGNALKCANVGFTAEGKATVKSRCNTLPKP